MARSHTAVVLLLALFAVAGRGQDEEVPPVVTGKIPAGTPAATVADAGLSKFQTLLDAALATEPLSNTSTVTLLAPSDEAIAAFLKELGIEEADIANNEPLADAIVAYHTIIGSSLGPKELFANGDKAAVPTAADSYKVVFTKTPTGVTVTDVQGNTANVIKAGLGTGKHQVHVIDKVLWSGSYWKDLPAVIKALPSVFSTFVAAAKAAGLDKTVLSADFADTLLVPTNAAFKKAGVVLSEVKPDDLKKLLTYHVIPSPHTLPSGFDSGKPVATLEGDDVTVTYIQENKVAGDKKANFFRAVVRDGQDNHATIIKPNLFYGKNVLHVLDQVLQLPKPAKKGDRRLLTAIAKPAVTAAVLSVKPADTAAAATAKPAAAATTAAAAKPEAATKPDAVEVVEATVLEVPAVDDLGKLDIEVFKAVASNGPFVETPKDKKGKKGNVQALFHEDAKKYTGVIQPDLAALTAAAPAAVAKPAAAAAVVVVAAPAKTAPAAAEKPAEVPAEKPAAAAVVVVAPAKTAPGAAEKPAAAAAAKPAAAAVVVVAPAKPGAAAAEKPAAAAAAKPAAAAVAVVAPAKP